MSINILTIVTNLVSFCRSHQDLSNDTKFKILMLIMIQKLLCNNVVIVIARIFLISILFLSYEGVTPIDTHATVTTTGAPTSTTYRCNQPYNILCDHRVFKGNVFSSKPLIVANQKKRLRRQGALKKQDLHSVGETYFG